MFIRTRRGKSRKEELRKCLEIRIHYSPLLSITTSFFLLDVFIHYLQCVVLRVEKDP